MDLLVGTSGYSYKEWKGPFYPEKLPAKEMLRFYAERLPSVEINNTFYRMPKSSVLETWADQVPSSFRFAVKASRRITHLKRLKDVGEEVSFLLGNLELLGPRLGCVLFQLPPNLKLDLERFDRFLDLLPKDAPAAFEFRHASWHDPEVGSRLSARNFAGVDVDSDEAPCDELTPTANWGYLRLRKGHYRGGELRDWIKRVRGSSWQRAFVFFKHEDAGAGPKLAGQFLELAASTEPRKAAPRRSRAVR